MQPIELNGSVTMVTKRNTYIQNYKNYFTRGNFRQSVFRYAVGKDAMLTLESRKSMSDREFQDMIKKQINL